MSASGPRAELLFNDARRPRNTWHALQKAVGHDWTAMWLKTFNPSKELGRRLAGGDVRSGSSVHPLQRRVARCYHRSKRRIRPEDVFTNARKGYYRHDTMYAIYFRWKVAPGRETEFERAWLELTDLVRRERGGLGSRLHRCADGDYFAYAQWPSEACWAAQPEPNERMIELRSQMRECAALVDGPHRGDVVADLLIPSVPDEAGQAGIGRRK